jgi:hypothetical protein
MMAAEIKNSMAVHPPASKAPDNKGKVDISSSTDVSAKAGGGCCG